MNAMNPQFWPLEETRTMWTEHLDATLEEATTHLTGDFAGEVAAYDLVHDLALEMADFISSGVIRQFPRQLPGRRHALSVCLAAGPDHAPSCLETNRAGLLATGQPGLVFPEVQGSFSPDRTTAGETPLLDQARCRPGKCLAPARQT